MEVCYNRRASTAKDLRSIPAIIACMPPTRRHSNVIARAQCSRIKSIRLLIYLLYDTANRKESKKKRLIAPTLAKNRPVLNPPSNKNSPRLSPIYCLPTYSQYSKILIRWKKEKLTRGSKYGFSYPPSPPLNFHLGEERIHILSLPPNHAREQAERYRIQPTEIGWTCGMFRSPSIVDASAATRFAIFFITASTTSTNPASTNQPFILGTVRGPR